MTIQRPISWLLWKPNSKTCHNWFWHSNQKTLKSNVVIQCSWREFGQVLRLPSETAHELWQLATCCWLV
jgi:hypothetical protein